MCKSMGFVGTLISLLVAATSGVGLRGPYDTGWGTYVGFLFHLLFGDSFVPTPFLTARGSALSTKMPTLSSRRQHSCSGNDVAASERGRQARRQVYAGGVTVLYTPTFSASSACRTSAFFALLSGIVCQCRLRSNRSYCITLRVGL